MGKKQSYFEDYTELIGADGTVYKFDDWYKFVVSETGFGAPPIEFITQSGPLQHGDTVLDYRLRPRIIQQIVRYDACDREDYWTKRAELLDAIRPNRHPAGQVLPATLRKRLPGGVVYDLAVFVEQGPAFAPRDPRKWDEFGFTDTIRYRADDPIALSPTLNTSTWVLTPTDDLIFPITFPIIFGSTIINSDITVRNPGTWESYPKIVMQGPCNSPLITNQDIDESIKLNYAVSTGETVTIELTPEEKLVYNQLSVNLLGTVDLDESDLATFRIEVAPAVADGDNVINVTASGAVAGVTSISLSFYPRFYGF